MKIKLLCLFIFILTGKCTYSQSQPVLIIDTLFEQIIIESSLVRTADSQHENYNLDDARKLEYLPVSEFPLPNQRKHGSVWWSRLILENRLNLKQELWLSVSADFSHGFLVRASGEIEKSQAGILCREKTEPYREFITAYD